MILSYRRILVNIIQIVCSTSSTCPKRFRSEVRLLLFHLQVTQQVLAIVNRLQKLQQHLRHLFSSIHLYPQHF